jgi:hypothetical protein
MDDELKGEGNSANYKYRMHDPRIGRFFAIDPLRDKYPHNSPYAFSENKVIAWVELEGLEGQWYYLKTKPDGTAVVTGFELKEFWNQAVWPSFLVIVLDDNDPLHIGSFCASCDSGDDYVHAVIDAFKKNPQEKYTQYAEIMEDLSKEAAERKIKDEEYKEMCWQMGAAKYYQNSKISDISEIIVKPRWKIAPAKFNYFRGKKIAKTGDRIKDDHNYQRAIQNKRDFKKLSLNSKSTLVGKIDEAFEKGEIVSQKTNKYGTGVVKKLEIEGKGAINVTFFYENGDMNSTPKVTTIIPQIYKEK